MSALIPRRANQVSLDAATLAALENVSIDNFPATQTVDGEVSLSPATLSALEGITVDTGLVQAVTNSQLRATPVPVIAEYSVDTLANLYSPEFSVQHYKSLLGKDASLYHIMGSRILGWNSTSALGDACEYLDSSQNSMNTPTTGQTLYLVSTSVNDTAAGTGARTVRIIFLDINGLQQIRTETLNGTTPVSIGSGYNFIQWMEVDSVGSGSVSAGNITISSTNGAATVATTFERITAGGNRSLSGRYKVPSDCHGHLIHWDIAAISNTMDVRLRSTSFMDDNSLSTVYHFLDRGFLSSGQTTTQDLEYRELPSDCVIKISAIPGAAAAGNKLDCSFSLIVMKN